MLEEKTADSGPFVENEVMETPRFEERESFTVAGITERYAMPDVSGIPAQWQKFGPRIGKIAGQMGWTTYGICFNMDTAGNMDYMCAVEVESAPEGLNVLKIPSQLYAVFTHREHISKIKETWDAIFSQWLPSSKYQAVVAPQFESYGSDFDSQAGTGPVEIWIPVIPKN
jgi:AraC family transcriptional regulator